MDWGAKVVPQLSPWTLALKLFIYVTSAWITTLRVVIMLISGVDGVEGGCGCG